MATFLRTVVRRALFLSVALSTMACVALSCLWWESYRGGPGRLTLETEQRLFEGRSSQGRAHVQVIRNWPGAKAKGFTHFVAMATLRAERRFLNALYFEADVTLYQPTDVVQLAAGRDTDVVSGGGARMTFPQNPPVARVLSVPYGYLVFVTGLPLALWVIVVALRAPARARLARRRRRGECVRCGYDLRFRRGRCPECGDPIPPRAGG